MESPSPETEESDAEFSETELSFIEEESDTEPELECENWDDDTRCLMDTLRGFTGYHLMPTCTPDPEEHAKKRIKTCPQIRASLLEDTFKTNFHNKWQNNSEFLENSLEFTSNPFKVCVISDFLQNPNVLKDIRLEFNEVDWNTRNMDLYEFFQSNDLKRLTHLSAINSLYEFLQTEVMQWVSQLTGIDLTHISATCSYYSNTDYLLVHDDQREDRMIAFVLYITESDQWEKEWGGALQLLANDESGQPTRVCRDVYPANNQLVFFPVTNTSYHQVAEVTSLTECRLSVNGWFHTKVPPTFQTPIFTPIGSLYSDILEKAIDFDGDLSTWINNDYLQKGNIVQIQQYFEEHSEISLKNFLKIEPFSELLQILGTEDVGWREIGPPNRYRYEIVDKSTLPQVIERLMMLFQSKKMFKLLQRFTGLDLSKKSAGVKGELQKWTPGSYSLLTDYDWMKKKELDVVIHFGCQNNCDVIGGRTQYVTTEDKVESALITLDPEQNHLNIIYRDTARFTKYYSKQSRCRSFYTLICSYSE